MNTFYLEKRHSHRVSSDLLQRLYKDHSYLHKQYIYLHEHSEPNICQHPQRKGVYGKRELMGTDWQSSQKTKR